MPVPANSSSTFSSPVPLIAATMGKLGFRSLYGPCQILGDHVGPGDGAEGDDQHDPGLGPHHELQRLRAFAVVGTAELHVAVHATAAVVDEVEDHVRQAGPRAQQPYVPVETQVRYALLGGVELHVALEVVPVGGETLLAPQRAVVDGYLAVGGDQSLIR